jgi:hypothetical protein
MFCPTCGLKQTNEESRFCSRCGFLLTGITQIISNGGILPQTFYNQTEIQNNVVTIRKKGLKQGGKMILTGLILVPMLGILSEIIGFNTFFIGLTAIITFWGGFLRMIYALIFEGNETETLEQKAVRFYRKVFKKQKNYEALPPEQSIPVSDFSNNRQGMWRETSDLRKNK